MKNLFFIALTFFGLRSIAQQAEYSTPSADFISFQENLSTANRMFKNDSLLQAYGKFDVAFASYKGAINAGDYFRAAICAINIKEEFKALDFLEKAVVNGFEIDSSNSQHVSFFNQNTKKEYLDGINKWHEQALQYKNVQYENDIKILAENAKKYNTTKYTNAIQGCIDCMKSKNCNKTTPDYQSKYRLVKEKMKADSITAEELLKKIQINGFPSIKTVGKKASDMGRLILLNFDADRNNKRLNGLLYKALAEANISPEFYATLIDRRNTLNAGAPEFYQPSTGYEKTIATTLNAINKKRNSIGLYQLVAPKLNAPKPKDPKVIKVETTLYDY